MCHSLTFSKWVEKSDEGKVWTICFRKIQIQFKFDLISKCLSVRREELAASIIDWTCYPFVLFHFLLQARIHPILLTLYYYLSFPLFSNPLDKWWFFARLWFHANNKMKFCYFSSVNFCPTDWSLILRFSIPTTETNRVEEEISQNNHDSLFITSLMVECNTKKSERDQSNKCWWQNVTRCTCLPVIPKILVLGADTFSTIFNRWSDSLEFLNIQPLLNPGCDEATYYSLKAEGLVEEPESIEEKEGRIKYDLPSWFLPKIFSLPKYSSYSCFLSPHDWDQHVITARTQFPQISLLALFMSWISFPSFDTWSECRNRSTLLSPLIQTSMS